MVTRNKIQSSHRWYFLGRTSWRFLWCWFCCCSLLVVFLHSHFLFHIIPHPSMDYRQVFRPVLYFQPSPSQSDWRHFYSQPFRYLLTLSATILSGHFLPTGVFYFMPYLTFWHNLLLSRLPWDPAVIPQNLQGFILILETQIRPICLFDSQ